jgi:hypothetical protein
LTNACVCGAGGRRVRPRTTAGGWVLGCQAAGARQRLGPAPVQAARQQAAAPSPSPRFRASHTPSRSPPPPRGGPWQHKQPCPCSWCRAPHLLLHLAVPLPHDLLDVLALERAGQGGSGRPGSGCGCGGSSAGAGCGGRGGCGRACSWRRGCGCGWC